MCAKRLSPTLIRKSRHFWRLFVGQLAASGSCQSAAQVWEPDASEKTVTEITSQIEILKLYGFTAFARAVPRLAAGKVSVLLATVEGNYVWFDS
jgi:hypothetical protein